MYIHIHIIYLFISFSFANFLFKQFWGWKLKVPMIGDPSTSAATGEDATLLATASPYLTVWCLMPGLASNAALKPCLHGQQQCWQIWLWGNLWAWTILVALSRQKFYNLHRLHSIPARLEISASTKLQKLKQVIASDSIALKAHITGRQFPCQSDFWETARFKSSCSCDWVLSVFHCHLQVNLCWKQARTTLQRFLLSPHLPAWLDRLPTAPPPPCFVSRNKGCISDSASCGAELLQTCSLLEWLVSFGNIESEHQTVIPERHKNTRSTVACRRAKPRQHRP